MILFFSFSLKEPIEFSSSWPDIDSIEKADTLKKHNFFPSNFQVKRNRLQVDMVIQEIEVLRL